MYHSSSRLYERPSEEYITRNRAIAPVCSEYDSRIAIGAVFDGMGYYTTDSPNHAIEYVGGENVEGRIEGIINGYHTYSYDIRLDKDVNFIDFNSRNSYDALPSAMLDRLDAALMDSHGVSLSEIEAKTGQSLLDAGCVNSIQTVERAARNPLVSYGLDNAEILNVLKDAGIFAKRGQNGNGVIVIIALDQLEAVSRFEIARAPPALEALQKLYPENAETLESLPADELADQYLEAVMVNNNGIITDYHEDKILASLVEDKGLRLAEAQDVVRAAKGSIADLDYHRVYQGYERPARYSMDRHFVLPEPVRQDFANSPAATKPCEEETQVLSPV